MATAALRRSPVGHEDRLSLVEHLDELRSRLIVSAIALLLIFVGCFSFNGALLNFINEPLENETQKSINKGRGPLGETARAQQAVKRLAAEDKRILSVLAAPGSGLSAAARAELELRIKRIDVAISGLPEKTPGNKPVTLGVAEPFRNTLMVSGYFALLIALPLLLYQAYAFVVPAFSPTERKAAVPLLLMVPFLFLIGVAFGYFVVLPAAVRFLQNFNSDDFNILVQAKDYYRFAIMTLAAMGLVFQMPVGILALTRLGVVTVEQLRKNRRYAILGLAVVAMLLPGTDPVSMLLILGPLLVLYELSVLLASLFRSRAIAAEEAAGDQALVEDEDPGEYDDDEESIEDLFAETERDDD